MSTAAVDHAHIRQKLDYFYQTKKVPHLIFHGSSGTGKRTLVYNFLNTIYGQDKHKIKTHVMMVNCAHGKGIKFVRDELKFFAKTNVLANHGIPFKTIVLFNADSLTIDAQSALRRCIELFSHNTRFFIVVENKHKLLNPILSRFCEIYVPERIDASGNVVNLHRNHLNQIYDSPAWTQYYQDRRNEMDRIMCSERDDVGRINLVTRLYENGSSCLDLLEWIRQSPDIRQTTKIAVALHFQQIKSEYRCEKLLMCCILDFLRSCAAAAATAQS